MNPKIKNRLGCFKMLGFVKYEIFNNGKWKSSHKCPRIKKNKIYRVTTYYNETYTQRKKTTYYLGKFIHRLDGPALLHYDRNGNIWEQNWRIFGKILPYFEEYNPSKEIFEYARRYTYVIKEIEILARHNKWLNENQILLLHASEMFQ
jgi:hypothetical protein